MGSDTRAVPETASPSAPYRYCRGRYRTRAGNVYVMDRVRTFNGGDARSMSAGLKPGCRTVSVEEAGAAAAGDGGGERTQERESGGAEGRGRPDPTLAGRWKRRESTARTTKSLRGT